MEDPQSKIRNISDTARWAAVYRARETERPDANFRDPFARRLAGERGDAIAKSMPFSDRAYWAWVARTVLFDRFILDCIRRGADMIINLAAGLDARPYRMALPPALRWVEVDLPDILEYKEEILAGEKPVCSLERARLDLADVNARRELFARLGGAASNAVVITEGLLIYFSTEEVATLARDLAAQPGFHHWLADIVSPGLLRMLEKNMGARLEGGGASFKFAPAEGPNFFVRYGWKAAEVRGMLKAAVGMRRLPLLMRMLAILPESNGKQGNRPWSAVCRLEKQ